MSQKPSLSPALAATPTDLASSEPEAVAAVPELLEPAEPYSARMARLGAERLAKQRQERGR